MKRWGIVFIMVGWLGLQAVSSASGGEELFDVKSADEHFNKGLILYFQEDYTGAIQEFAEAIRINPGNAKAYYFTGYAYYKQGDFSKASEAFKNAYGLDTDYSPIPSLATSPETKIHD